MDYVKIKVFYMIPALLITPVDTCRGCVTMLTCQIATANQIPYHHWRYWFSYGL